MQHLFLLLAELWFFSLQSKYKIMIRLSNKRLKIFNKFVLALGVLGAVFYPILIDPFLDPEKYRERQRQNRKNIRREDIQPGNMNIWRDPFAPKPTTQENK